MKKKKSKIVWITGILLIVFTISSSLGTVVLYKSQNPKALKLKNYAKNFLTNSKLPDTISETEGLNDIKQILIYENNNLISNHAKKPENNKLNKKKDHKKIYISDPGKRLINYTSGYKADFPGNASFSFEYSPIFTKVKTDHYDLVVSREYSPYEDVKGYIDHYLNRFILNNEYQEKNHITINRKEDKKYNNHHIQIISTTLGGLPASENDGYTYVTINTNTRVFYRFLFKHRSGFEDIDKHIEGVLKSFQYFRPQGNGYYDLQLKPVLPENWSAETKELYQKIKNSDDIQWGIFTKDIYGEGIDVTVPEIEKEIEYQFPVILSYIHFNTKFPVEFMKKNYENGKITELTYQITESNNGDLFGYTPNLDTYRGLKDDVIREFARDAKEFGHPFLFRLNNEMNSDWTSFSGVINMSDPEIYIENWRRFYKIFEEEGVDNAIWIFNPNDRNFPPCDWNHFLAYYPGNEYVQMIGLTGYNTGTYYKEEMGEQWREFKQIYDDVQEKYAPFFSEFPWIITEFASSSVGGNKQKWMEDMFQNIKSYENIKIAVWFSYADFDYRPEHENRVSRPYWLDETPETLRAFKEGVGKNKIGNLIPK